jgi:DNA polymerase III epsilon subunit-like protein
MEDRSEIIVIDFEATCLPVNGSWPIEVALGWPETGVVRSWLIKPDPKWLEDWNWSPESQRIHNITRDMLDNEGIPAPQVSREVAEALTAAPLLLSDQAGLEEFWLRCLMTALPR